MTDPYPILVERLAAGQALVIACQSCHAEATITADQILNEANYECPKGCGGSAFYKYDEGDKCPNCGKLGYWSHTHVLKGCCSRLCMLQWEYAQQLAERRAIA